MTRAFISYSHQDEPYRIELDKHLTLLRRQGVLDVWSDHCIRPGEDLDPAIDAAMQEAGLILLLISVDFLHSDYCATIELSRAMERHAARSAIVVPIILRPCDWHSASFGRLKALPSEGKPVNKWPTWDDAFLDITTQLRLILTPAKPARATAANDGQAVRRDENALATPAIPASVRMPRSSDLALPRTFTDEERHDFLVETFGYLQRYFEASLSELQARNQGISSRMTPVSPEAFKVIVFRDGKRVAGCSIRISSRFGGTGIAYSGNETSADNSYNEMLSVEADKHMLFMTAGMAMGRESRDRLTEEGAAEYLWKMLLASLR